MTATPDDAAAPQPFAPDPWRHFGVATATWFQRNFAAPTPAQIATWDALAASWRQDSATDAEAARHALVIAPTGSGKTLAAFLMSLDRLSRTAPTGKVRVLYVSPLKALAVDIENNLRHPLAGIQQTAHSLGLSAPKVNVAVRTGDTTPSERRRLITHPPDILITTPESLFLMLSSSAADSLDAVETVIVDEIHSLAGTKRGAHLAVSLERLDHLSRRANAMQRIGLSATVRPPQAVADFLAGPGRPVAVIDPPMPKQWTLDVRVPVDDMTNMGAPPGPSTEDDAPNYSIWPHIEEAILDLILAHRSTICFVNSRMVAERLTAHLNQRSAARLGLAQDVTAAMPNIYIGTHLVAASYDEPDAPLFDPGDDNPVTMPGPIVARAHHGSLSKERRAVIEADLKQGRLPCVVATSSLELGIDMGFVDLVIQTGSPPSVASGLQRVGRAGHHVGVASKGVVFPTSRADLLEATVVVQRMGAGQIEAVTSLSNPLDVLAQHVVSMCLDAAPTSQDVFNLVRRAQPFAALPRPAFDAVLEMLAGRYPSEDFAELRPRLTWDRATDRLSARPGSRQLVTTSGGTIPDRGLYGVFLIGQDDKRHGGRRVGELDEEMVHESRIGDVITLGSSSWRIDEITPHQVRVTPAPGAAGRLPFWHGDQLGRPFELGTAIGAFIENTSAAARPDATNQLRDAGLDQRAADNLVRYLSDQKRATGVLPNDKTIVFERCRDELGDWRVCLHAPFGLGVLRPWMMAIQQRLIDRYGVDARIIVHNDGVIWRLPASDGDPPGANLLLSPRDTLDQTVTQALFGSSLFAAHFRECAARALLLPRRNPGARTPLWQQRLRAAQLLEVAASYQSFPIVMEAMRECLDDVFDMPALRQLLADIAAGQVRLVEVETAQPSPFAHSLLFGYAGEFIYDADQPLAERASAAWSIDSSLLAGLLGDARPSQALDPQALNEVEAGLQRLRHPASSPEALWDMLRRIGPLTAAECAIRCENADAWLQDLAAARRVATVHLGQTAWVVAGDDALVASAAAGDHSARQRLTTRWLRCHVVTTAHDLSDRYGWPLDDCQAQLDALVAAGRVRQGVFDDSKELPQYGWPDVLQQVARRHAASLRAATRPVSPAHLAGFLADWHGITKPEAGFDAVIHAVEQLAGWPLPASMLETLVLPARVAGYQPAMLDEALTTGQVVWCGSGRIGDRDGWVTLWPADVVLTQPATDWLADDAEADALWRPLENGGAWRLADLGANATQAALWRLVWAGLATSDTFVPVRDIAQGALRHPRQPNPRRVGLLRAARPYVPALAGRWSAVRPTVTDATTRWAQAVTLEAGRHGIVTRSSVLAEPMTPSYTPAYKVLTAMEERGLVRRGYFIEDAGAAQFALPGAVDRLRNPPDHETVLLAACDPANPYGMVVDWPRTNGHRPARRAGAMVVLRDGRPICYLERGAHTLVTFEQATNDDLAAGLQTIGAAIDAAHLDPVALTRIDQRATFDDPTRIDLLRAARFSPTPQGFTRRANPF